jgi:AsmA-like C-terminal region
LRDGLSLRDVNLSVGFAAGDRLTAFSLDASGPAKGRIAGRFAATAAGRNVSFEAADGSQLIQGLTGFTSLRGGTAALHLTFPAEGATPTGWDYKGAINLRNVTVINQPFFARLFAIGSLEGPLRLLQGGGIPITKFDAPFTARGKIMTIAEGRASGSAVGFTFEGTIDRGHNRLDIKGSLVPVYGINGLLSDVPIVGNLLTSHPGEGVFGLTYAVRGDIDQPDIAVNPLSLMTPGILRRIFEFGSAPKPPAQTAPAPGAPVTPIAPPAQAQQQPSAPTQH